MVTCAELLARWRFVPLHGCPGRFVLRGAPPRLSTEELLGGGAPAYRYRVPTARDEVLLVLLPDGGLLSYLRPDGSLVHTLNTPEGLRRKLEQLGIPPPSSPATGPG